MGITKAIDETIRGKENSIKKEIRKIWQKKHRIKTDDEIIKEIGDESKTKNTLKIIYEDIVNILKEYLDMDEDYYSLIAIWIIGTYFHKDFESYPYLYINAMKGSGKTRLLKLIATISYNGELLASMSDAVLFRTASDRTFCIDEFESVGKKDKSILRELLNAAYKKGTKVKRMRKMGERQVVEEFEVYCPIAMANIWGMEEVLSDRCITLILEKSDKISITKLVENYAKNPLIQQIFTTLKDKRCSYFETTQTPSTQKQGGTASELSKCSLCSVVSPEKVYMEWNDYIKAKYITTLTTLNTYNTYNTQTTLNNTFFDKIDKADIRGRDLELFFPLFIISFNLGENILNNILNISKKIMKEKQIEEITESKDVSLIDFISKLESKDEYFCIKDLFNMFITFLQEDERSKPDWLNTKWLGRALKRLRLINEKRRLGRGIEIIPDIKRAKQKIKMFKPISDDKIAQPKNDNQP